MTATIIMLSYDDKCSNCCYWPDMEDNGRNRKRRRPQHEHLENSSQLTSREHSPTRQKTEVIKTTKINRCSGRRRHSYSPPLFLWIALMFACYQKYQFSVVLATRLRERTKHQSDMLPQQQQRFLQTVAPSAPTINYLELPISLWTSKGSRDHFFEGNAIRVSPFDKDILYATNRKGDLRVLSAPSGKSIETVSPSPRTLTEDGATSTWGLYSNSGMAFGSFPGTASDGKNAPGNDSVNDEDDSYNDYLQFLINNGINQDQETAKQSHFAVYSIVDEAPAVSRFLPKSRVVCVSIPEHKILWASAGLPGTPNGSPVVYHVDEATTSQNKNDNEIDDSSGMYIVLTHNSVLIRPDNTTQATGHLTVLDPMTGHVKWTQSEWSRDEVPKGYSPPQVSRNPILGGGNSGGSLGNKNDVIVWTSSDDEGRGRLGNLYSFQMKSSSELEADMKNENKTVDEQNDPFEIRVLKQVRWNSIARPTMNRDGTSLFVGVTGNAVRGWNGEAKFNETANWSTQLVPLSDGLNASSQQTYSNGVVVSTAPVLSADEERLFVVTVRNETVCLNTKTGIQMWSEKTQKSSQLFSEPKASPDNQRLYVIMSKNGKVHGINQKDGKALWSFGCDENNLPSGSTCATPTVAADFDLSADGTILYYGAADGRIVALTLGHRVVENNKGGQSPSIPTSTSTVSIVYDGDEKERGPMEFDKTTAGTHHGNLVSSANNQNLGVKIAGTIVAIIVSMAVTMVSIMYVMRAKGVDLRDLRNYRLPRNGFFSKDDGGKRHTRVERVGRGRKIPDGPDRYEDQIIASLSEDESIESSQFNTLWVDPTHSNPKPIINDDESPPADRLSVLLGTSNRIAPIMDNFGFGQAVLI
jgi:outer membrane protein assembly factor BamB